MIVPGTLSHIPDESGPTGPKAEIGNHARSQGRELIICRNGSLPRQSTHQTRFPDRWKSNEAN